MHRILCVHGAGASPVSFSWLAGQLPAEVLTFSYSLTEDVAAVVQRLRGVLAAQDTQVVLLGHSLGGLIAALAGDAPNVSKVVTLCAPFGGIKSSALMTLLSTAPLFRDTSPYGAVLSGLRFHGKPHLAIFGRAGLPLPGVGDNDGVVSVASQKALAGPEYLGVDLNHFEVLLSAYVATVIEAFLA